MNIAQLRLYRRAPLRLLWHRDNGYLGSGMAAAAAAWRAALHARIRIPARPLLIVAVADLMKSVHILLYCSGMALPDAVAAALEWAVPRALCAHGRRDEA